MSKIYLVAIVILAIVSEGLFLSHYMNKADALEKELAASNERVQQLVSINEANVTALMERNKRIEETNIKYAKAKKELSSLNEEWLSKPIPNSVLQLLQQTLSNNTDTANSL